VKFPATSNELRAAGYEYDNDGVCRGCGAPMEWWITPSGKKMPLVVIKAAPLKVPSDDMRQPHFQDCPAADQFRRK